MRKSLVLPMLALAACVAWTGNPALASSPAVPSAAAPAIDALFADYARPDSPGCAFAVYRRGETIYAKGYGQANLEYGIAIDPRRSVFNIGSTSKQFTAASVLLLVQDGKLQLGDEIHRFLPELPDYGHPITIDQLLHQSSGLRDYTLLLGLGSVLQEDYLTAEQLLQLIARQRSLGFEPGSRFSYSNTGYFLLGQIVERVSGQPLREFAAERLFKPLGMRDTFFQDDHLEVISRLASSYAAKEKGGFDRMPANWEIVGDGSLHTTLTDLARWDRNFYTHEVGGRALIEGLQERGRLDDGSPLDYARGLFIGDQHGLRRYNHPGSQNGYRAELLRLPERDLSVAVLCNAAESDPAGLAEQIADLWLGVASPRTAASPPEPAALRAEPPAEAVTDPARFTGLFWSAESGLIRRIEWREGQLRYVRPGGPESTLDLVSEGHLRMLDSAPATTLRFSRGKHGRRLSVGSEGSKPTEFEEVQPFLPDATGVQAFAGRYRSDELDTEWQLRVADGRLSLHQPRYPVRVLDPAFADAFQFDFVLLRFQRDGQRVSGFVVDTARANGLRFEKLAD